MALAKKNTKMVAKSRLRNGNPKKKEIGSVYLCNNMQGTSSVVVRLKRTLNKLKINNNYYNTWQTVNKRCRMSMSKVMQVVSDIILLLFITIIILILYFFATRTVVQKCWCGLSLVISLVISCICVFVISYFLDVRERK